ncbi:MAG TPA: histidine kinase [Luteimonas sp.]
METSQPAGHSALRPLDTLWQANTVIRIVLAGEALAVVLALAPGAANDRLAYFGMASFAIQWIALGGMGILYAARAPLEAASPVAVARVALAALLLSTWLVTLLAWLFLRDLWPLPAGGWPWLALRLTVMALMVGLLALAAFRAHWHVRQMAVRAKQAELEALQARIRPHFLFNTLNTGIALLHGRPGEAERLLLDLSDLFRAALAGPAEVTLEEELSLARRYLEIESLRFGPRLEACWGVTASEAVLAGTRLPSLSVQPLVENAIRHGIESSGRGGTVSIEVGTTADAVLITVRNPLPDGGGRSIATGHGIGLAAVRARIEAMPGGVGTLATSTRDGEFVARLRIALKPLPDA